MASTDTQLDRDQITEDVWKICDCHLMSYVRSPIQLWLISSKTLIFGRALRSAVVDLLNHIAQKSDEYIENETTVMGTEHRLYHSRRYTVPLADSDHLHAESSDMIELEISSLAPAVFYRLREDVGISNTAFLQSFSRLPLKDFTNPGKSGSLMYKTSDDLFILKTLRHYEAVLLLQMLSGYQLQLNHRPSILNRYVGLYSIRFPALLSSMDVYIVIMANAFTPSLRINEVFDLKGSSMKRRLIGNLSKDKLHSLKDLDFMDLYPKGIRIPSNIYRCLYTVISNDAKALRKLYITDYSLILGIRQLDVTEDDLMLNRPATGVSALLHMSHRLALTCIDSLGVRAPSSINSQTDSTPLPIVYLKPLEMIKGPIDPNLFYDNDSIASAALPIPGIDNTSNQRVYIYLAIVDMLQTFDSFKYIEQTFKKLTDHSRSLQYSVIEPDEYERRFIKFLFEQVFTDSGDDFPWNITEVNQPVTNGDHQSEGHNTKTKKKLRLRSVEPEYSNPKSIIEFRL